MCLGLLFALLFLVATYHFCHFFCAKSPTNTKGRGENKQKRGIFYRSRGLIFKVVYSLYYTVVLYCLLVVLLLLSAKQLCLRLRLFVQQSIFPGPRACALTFSYLRPRRSLYTSSFGHNTHRPRLSLTSGFKPVKYYYQCEIKVFFT